MKLLGCALVLAGVMTQCASAAELLVVNQRTHSVLFVDPAEKKIVAKVELDVAPHEVALSPDGRFAYTPIYGDAASVGLPGTNGQTIAVVDVKQHKLVRTIDLKKAARPHRALFAPNGLLYVTTELENSLSAVDVKTGNIVATIPTGSAQTHMFTLNADGSRAYTANVSDGTVSVLDLKAKKLMKVIPVSKRVQRVSVSNDGRWVFTNDQTKPQVVMIDAATNEVKKTVPVSAIPFAAQETPDGKWLMVVEGEHMDGTVEAINTKAWTVEHTVKLPGRPSSMLVHDGKLYMTLLYAGKVLALDLKTWQVEQIVGDVGGVDGIAWVP